MASQRMMQRFARWHIWLGWAVAPADPAVGRHRPGHGRAPARGHPRRSPARAARRTSTRRRSRFPAAHRRADPRGPPRRPAQRPGVDRHRRRRPAPGATRRSTAPRARRWSRTRRGRIAEAAHTGNASGAEPRPTSLAGEAPAEARTDRRCLAGALRRRHPSLSSTTPPASCSRCAPADWRLYDLLYGLHVMDPQTHEDAHNPFVDRVRRARAARRHARLRAAVPPPESGANADARPPGHPRRSRCRPGSTSPAWPCSRSAARCSPRKTRQTLVTVVLLRAGHRRRRRLGPRPPDRRAGVLGARPVGRAGGPADRASSPGSPPAAGGKAACSTGPTRSGSRSIRCSATAKALFYGVEPVPAMLMGVITGCVGGIIRDVLAGRPSILMRPELYVTAAALAATLCAAGHARRPAARSRSGRSPRPPASACAARR